jgi:hypothetical protein
MDEQRFIEAWETGRAMSLEQVMEYAIDNVIASTSAWPMQGNNS